MLQDRSSGRKVGQSAGMRARRAAFGVALAGLLVGLDPSMVRAGDDGAAAGDSAWTNVMQKLGLSKPAGSEAEINYTERSPLVVPPTRDLPPPTAGPPPVPDWPKDPNKSGKRAKAKPGVVPATAVETPNPPVEKKPWYNPMGWFDREEYAKFNGEPVREDLTDPPAGYRIPSADQPYGVGAAKSSGKPQARPQDANLGTAAPPPSPPPPSGGQSGK